MTEPSLILAAEPQLFVADLGRALVFYETTLGFQTAFTWGEPPFYAQVVRGGARLNLRLVEGAVFDASFLERNPDPLAASLTLDDAEPLYREYEARGVLFHAPLRTEAWGARTFKLRDPDGNLLLFAGRGG